MDIMVNFCAMQFELSKMRLPMQ